MKILGARLKKLREGRHLTQAQVAEEFGLPQSSIYRYESGDSNPSPETLLRFADYYDVSMDYIFGRTDDPEGSSYRSVPKLDPELHRLAEQFFEPGTRVNRELKRSVIRIMAEEAASYTVVKRKEED